MHTYFTGKEKKRSFAHILHTQTLPASAVGGARDSWWGRTCPFPGEGFPLVASLHVFALHRRPLKHANVYNACHALTPLEDKGREGKNGRTKQNRSLWCTQVLFKCSIIAAISHTLSIDAWFLLFRLHTSLKPEFSFPARHVGIKFHSDCYAEIWTNWSKRRNLVWAINNGDINSSYFARSGRERDLGTTATGNITFKCSAARARVEDKGKENEEKKRCKQEQRKRGKGEEGGDR